MPATIVDKNVGAEDELLIQMALISRLHEQAKCPWVVQVACPSASDKALPRGQRATVKVLAGLAGESTSARVLRIHPARGRLRRRCRKCCAFTIFPTAFDEFEIDGAQFLHASCTVVEASNHLIRDIIPCCCCCTFP